MIISSPQFIVQSYADWYESLMLKNTLNVGSTYQNISAIGLVQRVSGLTFSNLIILVPVAILFALQYIPVKEYGNPVYQYGLLASTLIFIVLFSTGSENSTYIIAVTGVAIWFLIQKKPLNKYLLALFVFTLFLTLFANSDLIPAFIRREYIRPYSLKALPSLIVWFVLVYQLVTFRKTSEKELAEDYLIDSKQLPV
jgi:hypothetical protein